MTHMKHGTSEPMPRNGGPQPPIDSSPDSEEGRGEARALTDALHAALCDYRLTNMADEDGEAGYPLIDLCSNDGTTIDTGKHELLNLADFLAGDARVLTALASAPLASLGKGEGDQGDVAEHIKHAVGFVGDVRKVARTVLGFFDPPGNTAITLGIADASALALAVLGTTPPDAGPLGGQRNAGNGGGE